MIAHLIWKLSNLPSDASALRSAISALESDIAALDKSSGSPEYWLAGFTALVAIGVVIEIVVLHLDHKKEMEEWHVCELIPAKPTLVKVGWEIASIILVTVGVVGELGTGLWISHIDGILRSKNAELRTASDHLIAFINAEAEEAKRQAKEADLKRVELEKSMEWRKLSKAQEQKLCSALGPKLAKKYHVNAFADDLETVSYATAIGNALDRCELSGGLELSKAPHVGYVGRWAPNARPLFGVWVTFDASPPTPPIAPGDAVRMRKTEAIELRKKLESSGIAVTGITSDDEKILPLGVIFVGPRPPPNADFLRTPPPFVISSGPM